jgi:hypothetical protein
MKFQSDLDYVIYYAEEMRENPKLFNQQKKLIESQLNASKSLFSNWKGKYFKEKCRAYLRDRGIIV